MTDHLEPSSQGADRASPRRAARLALWAALFSTPAVAADPTAVADPQVVAVKTLADTPLYGRVRAFSLDHGLELETPGAAAPVTLPADEVVQILVNAVQTPVPSRQRGATPPEYTTVELQLLGGDRLWGKPVAPTDDSA
ncbi:MAG: hypothetical protein V2A79_13295, partial [Planctomycetota bacterium]